ncbi:uncharacterized protein LOC126095720 [Schistocerca cancellata]|uniref:uncharacterized protein LOC126095720 n=1 Tax=Schistocerca cancellata TaxID=274614 RepID=UPI002117546B|nr:uncharacterized protein LOC126095720 [Schistocerca cancellata]
MAELLGKLRSAWKTWRKQRKGRQERVSDPQKLIGVTEQSDKEHIHAASIEDTDACANKDNSSANVKSTVDSPNSGKVCSHEENKNVNETPIEVICEYANDADIDIYRAEGLTDNELRTIICSLAEKICREFPSYYDFCIIADEEDYDSADELKHYLCRTFDLTGCMVHDGFYRAGADIFSCFEFMMSRSSKVLFYLTDNFNASQFYRRIQSGAVFQSLMSSVQAHREKCVPIFPNGIPNYIPLPLSGIAGLHPKSKVALRQSINTTYTLPLREKRKCLDRLNDDERRLAFREQLRLSVSDFIQKKELQNSTSETHQIENAHSAIDVHTSTSILPEVSSNVNSGNEQPTGDTIADTLASLPMDDEARTCIMQVVSQSSPLPATNVSITSSSGVHVGNKVTVNLTINPPVSYSGGTTGDAIMNDSDSDSFSESE